MSIDRATILGGPAVIQVGGQTFHTKDGITCKFDIDPFEIKSDSYGSTDLRAKDFRVKLSFTPVGQWTTALLAVMYPYTNPIAGTSIFGATDTAVTLFPMNGKEKMVFSCGAVTKMPDIIASASATPFKAMEITLLLKNQADRNAADALYALTATESFSDSSYDLSQVLTSPYTASLASASAPWNAIETEAGFDISFALKLNPRKTDSLGVIDMAMGQLDIVVKLKPVGLTVAQVLTQLKVQGTGVAIGMSLGASAANLTITGGTGNPVIVINKVRLKNAEQLYNQEAMRHGILEFVATRPTGSGVMFSVGIVA